MTKTVNKNAMKTNNFIFLSFSSTYIPSNINMQLDLNDFQL